MEEGVRVGGSGRVDGGSGRMRKWEAVGEGVREGGRKQKT